SSLSERLRASTVAARNGRTFRRQCGLLRCRSACRLTADDQMDRLPILANAPDGIQHVAPTACATTARAFARYDPRVFRCARMAARKGVGHVEHGQESTPSRITTCRAAARSNPLEHAK